MPPGAVDGFDGRAVCEGFAFEAAEVAGVALDEAEESGFPTAGGAHDGDELPWFEAGVDILEDAGLFAFGVGGFVTEVDEVDSHGEDRGARGVGVFVAFASSS